MVDCKECVYRRSCDQTLNDCRKHGGGEYDIYATPTDPKTYILNISAQCRIKANSEEEANERFWKTIQKISSDAFECRYSVEDIHLEPDKWTD